MKNIKAGFDDELEFLECLIEIIDDKLKELNLEKAKYMARYEGLRKDLYDE